MGIELVEGQDLFVRDEAVYMRTTQGPQRVDVIYRRIDDDFLDPLAFRPDSMLGVPGLLTRLPRRPRHHCQCHRHRRRRRQVHLSVRAGHDPLLSRPRRRSSSNVQTWMLRRQEDLDYVLAHLAELVVKEVHGAGGYGMLIGPAATKARDRGVPRPHHRHPGALHRAADAGAVDLPDLRAARARRRATSICGPSCCRAGTSPSCPAASRAWRCAKARWWSTPRRAAAPRTPGCWKH